MRTSKTGGKKSKGSSVKAKLSQAKSKLARKKADAPRKARGKSVESSNPRGRTAAKKGERRLEKDHVSGAAPSRKVPPAVLDKNFRLPRSVRPTNYWIRLSLRPEQLTFEGEQTIALRVEKPTQELILHAVDLELSNVVFRGRDGQRLEPAAIEPAKASGTVVIQFDEPLPTGDAQVSMRWTGKYSKGLRGLYHADGLSVTQFEAADARRAIPSFDEPSFKASWQMTLEVPKDLTALSNAPIAREEVKGERRTVVFKQTQEFSSYLVSLAVGRLVSTEPQRVGETEVRTWTSPEKAHLAKFGQQIAVEALPLLEAYFDLKYQFAKVDQVAVSNFEAGAMENVAMITFRETALLLDLDNASMAALKRVAEVVIHELVHQWFGNWVTMEWWDDLWLNEAFATWMAFKILDKLRPEWAIWLDFDDGSATALHLDALSSTHPIRGEIRNADEAGEAFDAITYEKGGAVLRMLESYLGEEKFRDGLRAYMKKFGKKNTVADDLWNALAEASGQPILEVANAWICKSGYPVVTAEREGSRVRLSQQRFFSAPGMKGDESWPVPMVLRYQDDEGVKEQRVLLDKRTEQVQLDAVGEVRWVYANGGNTGFYRVGYGIEELQALTENLSALDPSERVALIADRWALVRSNRVSVKDFLDLCAGFHEEEHYAVLNELVARLGELEKMISDVDRPSFQAFVEDLLGSQFQAVGWNPATGEPNELRLRRQALVSGLGLVGRSAAVVEEARARVARYLDGDTAALEPNLHAGAVLMAARAGDAQLFERLQVAYREEREPNLKRRYLMALGAFESPELARRGQSLALTETVPMQDFAGYVGTLLTNKTARDAFWATLRAEWGQVKERTGAAPMILRRLVEAVGQLPDRVHYEEAKRFFEEIELPEAKQAKAQTLERMGQGVELRERSRGAVSEWLNARGE